jgi:hypothetical protein
LYYFGVFADFALVFVAEIGYIVIVVVVKHLNTLKAEVKNENDSNKKRKLDRGNNQRKTWYVRARGYFWACGVVDRDGAAGHWIRPTTDPGKPYKINMRRHDHGC